jgi:hypothetical protein
MIVWNKRAQRASSGSRVWRSTCGNYVIHASEECQGIKLPSVRYVARVRRRVRDRDGFAFIWVEVSRHKNKTAAMRACDKHAQTAA